MPAAHQGFIVREAALAALASERRNQKERRPAMKLHAKLPAEDAGAGLKLVG